MCDYPTAEDVTSAFARLWHYCTQCQLTSLAPEQLPSAKQEESRYRNHRNNPEDQGYVQYLNLLLEPLSAYLLPQSRGLDFGSGAESVVQKLLAAQGLEVQEWDPIFRPDTPVLEQKYHFLTATEVVEHFHEPKKSFSIINSLLEEGGVFGLLTQIRPEQLPLNQWPYARDTTHVSFYTERTFEVIAEMFSWRVLLCQSHELPKSPNSRPIGVIFKK